MLTAYCLPLKAYRFPHTVCRLSLILYRLLFTAYRLQRIPLTPLTPLTHLTPLTPLTTLTPLTDNR